MSMCLSLFPFLVCSFFFSSRRRHTRCALVTGAQTCALPILILEYLFGSAALAVGWSGYFVKLVGDAGLHLPDALVQGPFLLNGHEIVSTGALFNLPAAALILFGGLVVTMGTSSVAQFGSVVEIGRAHV